jgi:hypothetical protein
MNVIMGCGWQKRRERVCCLLVLNSVTSTPQWIRQPEAAWGIATRRTSASATVSRLEASRLKACNFKASTNFKE